MPGDGELIWLEKPHKKHLAPCMGSQQETESPKHSQVMLKTIVNIYIVLNRFLAFFFVLVHSVLQTVL